MGYLKISNLYQRSNILQCYALEKVDGTSAHIKFHTTILEEFPDPLDNVYKTEITLFSGGAKHDQFIQLFNEKELLDRFVERFPLDGEVTVYGEAFGGKLQGMSATYGPNLRFVAFDIKHNEKWYNVPYAEEIVKYLGLDFVPYERGPLTIEFLDEQRDRDSLVAIKPGCIREGIVARPINELQDKNGGRIWIVKHKRKEFCETKTHREVSPEKLQVLLDAEEVAGEWVTTQRLSHVLQKTPFNDQRDIGNIIRAMIEDVKRESEGEVVWSKDIEKKIGKATSTLLLKTLEEKCHDKN